jgi:hypothetical protein
MTRLASFPKIRPKITADLQAYLDDFIQHQDTYQKQDGYFHRLASAELSARFLARFQPKEKQKFDELVKAFRNDSKSLSKNRIW